MSDGHIFSIADISSTAFIRPLPLIDYVMLILGKDRRTFTSITPMDLVLVGILSPISKAQRALCIIELVMDVALSEFAAQ
jgi:hypothetical protein